MRCRICVAISVSALLAIGRWYWYGGLKHKHQCVLQLQTISLALYKDSRSLLVKLFYQNNNNSAAAPRECRRIKEYGEVLLPYRV